MSNQAPRPKWWTCYDASHPDQLLYTRTRVRPGGDKEEVIVFDPDAFFLEEGGYSWTEIKEEAKLQYTMVGSCDDEVDIAIEAQYHKYLSQQDHNES